MGPSSSHSPSGHDLIANNAFLSRDDPGGLEETVLDDTPCIMCTTVDLVDLENSDALLESSEISLISPYTIIPEGMCGESGTEIQLDPLAPLFVPASMPDSISSPSASAGGAVSVLDVTPCAIEIDTPNISFESETRGIVVN